VNKQEKISKPVNLNSERSDGTENPAIGLNDSSSADFITNKGTKVKTSVANEAGRGDLIDRKQANKPRGNI